MPYFLGAFEAFPFLLDMATSVKALGKVAYYESCGKSIPQGWVADENGKIITEGQGICQKIYNRKSALLPLGGLGELTAGYKGYGLGTVVEILSSALAGGAFLSQLEVCKDGKILDGAMGHFFLVINAAGFTDINTFKQTTGDILREIRASRKQANQPRIWTAGEKEYFAWEKRKKQGIPINQAVQIDILTMPQELQLNQYQFPF